MRFSADAKLLYVLVNNPSKIFVLDVDKFVRGEMSVVSEFSMLECFEGQSVPSTTALGMTDLALLQDGWIAASSNDTARIYFIHYSEADAQFNAHSIFSTGPNGESLGDPRAIAYDPASGLCYILGYSKKLHIAAIKNPASDYSLISTIELDASLDKATSIAFAQNEYGSKVLGISGGAGLGMVSLDASGTPILQTSLLKTNESAAIASVKNICALSDTFITSGDATGLVSSFRLR